MEAKPLVCRTAPVIILFGSPGSGKGTQAKLLRESYHREHVSTGDMLRKHIEVDDEIGQEIRELMKSGKLVPDELVNRLVERRLSDADCRAGLILDGYPRTLNQASVLLDNLRKHGIDAVVVHLVVDYGKIVARLSGRRQCPLCGTLYNLTTNPPKVSGICDLDGTPLVTREDDRATVIRERLEQYGLQTRPLLDFFKQSGVPLVEVDAAGAAPEEIMHEISERLASLGVTQ